MTPKIKEECSVGRCDPPATQILFSHYIQHSIISTTNAARVPTVPRWEGQEPDKVAVTLCTTRDVLLIQNVVLLETVETEPARMVVLSGTRFMHKKRYVWVKRARNSSPTTLHWNTKKRYPKYVKSCCFPKKVDDYTAKLQKEENKYHKIGPYDPCTVFQ